MTIRELLPLLCLGFILGFVLMWLVVFAAFAIARKVRKVRA